MVMSGRASTAATRNPRWAPSLPLSLGRPWRAGAAEPVAGVSAAGQRFDWSGRVVAEPVDLFLFLKNRKPPVSWSIQRREAAIPRAPSGITFL